MSLLDMSEAKLSRDSFTFNVVGAQDLDVLWFAIDYGLVHERLFRRLRLGRLARTIHKNRPQGEVPKLTLQGEPAITAYAALRNVAWNAYIISTLQSDMRVKAAELLERVLPDAKQVIVRALEQRLSEDPELRECLTERSIATIALEALQAAGFVIKRRDV